MVPVPRGRAGAAKIRAVAGEPTVVITFFSCGYPRRHDDKAKEPPAVGENSQQTERLLQVVAQMFFDSRLI